MRGWWRRFLVRGVFWRRYLRFGVRNVPMWIEPVSIASWSIFFCLLRPVRRPVMKNLAAIKPGSLAIINLFRTYRVVWNFAWTISDTGRFKEDGVVPDWEFSGLEHFHKLADFPGGAIILTAHMGSYDVGAHLFSESTHRRFVMVRAPEADPATRQYEEKAHERHRTEAMRIDFNTNASELALDLLHALQEGHIVAVQGDRVTPGIASVAATMFGRQARIPSGPFALAMTARVPIFPLFVIRAGRRRYRLLSFPPIEVERRGRRRDEDLQRAIEAWARQLEQVIAQHWQQWFAFEEAFAESPA